MVRQGTATYCSPVLLSNLLSQQLVDAIIENLVIDVLRGLFLVHSGPVWSTETTELVLCFAIEAVCDAWSSNDLRAIRT